MMVGVIEDRLLAGYFGYLREIVMHRQEGHRPHYCEHGTNLWVDYDNICGPCEDGISMRYPEQRREFAEDEAERRLDAFFKAFEAMSVLKTLYMLPPEAESKISEMIVKVLDVNAPV